MRRALVDINIYSLAMRGDPDVLDICSSSTRSAFPWSVWVNCSVDSWGGGREEQNRLELARLLDSPRVRVLTIDEDTAEFYASAFQALRRAGTPIPTNDLWIAALAQRHGLPFYTRDTHFQAVARSGVGRMVQGLMPYPSYKDSGLPWLGKVPEHWEVRRRRRKSNSCENTAPA